MQKHPEWTARNQGIIWSLDNARAHAAALKGHNKKKSWQDQGMKGTVHLPPPYSPDIHQVVEHAIGNLSRELKEQFLQRAIRREGAYKDMKEVFELAQGIFKRVCSPKEPGGINPILANVKRMKQVYEKIVEVDGGYIARSLS